MEFFSISNKYYPPCCTIISGDPPILRPVRLTLVSLAITVALSGCSGGDRPSGPDWSFGDADDRFSGSIGGEEAVDRPFTVPRSTTGLTIKANYNIGGVADINLREPNGRIIEMANVEGSAAVQDENWFVRSSPAPGVWRLQMAIQGGANYAFGMYYELSATDPAAEPESPAAPNAFSGKTAKTAALAGAGAALLVGAAVVGTEVGRYKFFGMLGALGLFSRLEKDEVLAHEKREQVYQYIKDNPGPSFSDLRRDLELSNGTLVHHLRILESQEFVRAYRDGFRTRFYLRGPKIVPTAYLTRTQQQLLDTIASNPGVTQKELSQLLGLPRESISYHAKRLAAQGQLQVRQEGKWRRYWTVGGGAPPGAEPTPL